jgi:hypothetical protein
MNESKSDGFIGSLLSLAGLEAQVRVNKCKCVVANFEIEEGKREDITQKMGEVNISETKEERELGGLTLEKLIFEYEKECPLSL